MSSDEDFNSDNSEDGFSSGDDFDDLRFFSFSFFFFLLFFFCLKIYVLLLISGSAASLSASDGAWAIDNGKGDFFNWRGVLFSHHVFFFFFSFFFFFTGAFGRGREAGRPGIRDSDCGPGDGKAFGNDCGGE
jgi:hypothetical protein